MNILIVSLDSDIGRAIAAVHVARGDTVRATSRHGLTRYHMELEDASTWPKFQEKFDRVYYCLAVSLNKIPRHQTMNINCYATSDFLQYVTQYLNTDAQIVVLSSLLGSTAFAMNAQGDLRIQKDMANYCITKAAMNMAVVILSQRNEQCRWLLMHPGLVLTKMTDFRTDVSTTMSPEQSANNVAGVADKNTQHISFLDGQANAVRF